jgi:hypothetical protein
MAQAVEHLPSNHEALSSNPSTGGRKQSLFCFVCLFVFLGVGIELKILFLRKEF